MNILSLEEQLKLIKENEWNFIMIDNPYKEVCLEALEVCGELILHIPEEKRTEDIWLAAIKGSGNVLEYISEEKKTQQMCLEAVKQDGCNLQYVPAKYMSQEICLEAIKNNGISIIYIPEEKRTYEMYLASVKQGGRNIEFVKNKNYEICFYAFLNEYILSIEKDIMQSVNEFIKNEINLNKKVFFHEFSKDKIERLFDEKEYELLRVDLKSLNYLKDYLLYKNSKNHFILDDKVDINILKEISLSNNELIIIDTGNITNIHKKIANKIISV